MRSNAGVGCVLMQLLGQLQFDDWKCKITAIRFADSVHMAYKPYLPALGEEERSALKSICTNYIASEKPIGTFIAKDPVTSGRMLSAGHNVHSRTPYAAMDAILKSI